LVRSAADRVALSIRLRVAGQAYGLEADALKGAGSRQVLRVTVWAGAAVSVTANDQRAVDPAVAQFPQKLRYAREACDAARDDMRHGGEPRARQGTGDAHQPDVRGRGREGHIHLGSGRQFVGVGFDHLHRAANNLHRAAPQQHGRGRGPFGRIAIDHSRSRLRDIT